MRAFTLHCMEQALKESNADALHVAAQILLTTFEAHGASQVDAATAAQLKLLQEHATSPVQPVLVELLLFLCGSNQYSGDFTFSLLLLLLQHFLPIAWTARNRDDLVQELVQHIHSSSMDQLAPCLTAVEAALESFASAAMYHSLFPSVSVATILPWCSASEGLLSHVSRSRLFDLLALAAVAVGGKSED